MQKLHDAYRDEEKFTVNKAEFANRFLRDNNYREEFAVPEVEVEAVAAS